MSWSIGLVEILKAAPEATKDTLPTLYFPLFNQDGLQKRSSDNVFMERGTATDLNQATKFGIYAISSECLNTPSATPNTSDRAIFLGSREIYGQQIYLPLHVSRGIMMRTVSNGNWTGWYVINTTAMPS